MKKLIFITVSCLILGSCTLGTSENVPSVTNEGTGVTQKSGTTQDTYKKSLDTASSKIANTEEFNSCMQTSVNMCVQSVGMQLAQKSKDVTLCNELPNIDQKESCKFGIIMTDAMEKQDPKLCKTLSATYAKQCTIEIYKNQALKNKDVELCKKIDDLENQGTGSTNQNTAPQMMGGADQCVFTVIMSNTGSTEKDCNTISNDQMQEMCKSSIKNRPKMMLPPEIQ